VVIQYLRHSDRILVRMCHSELVRRYRVQRQKWTHLPSSTRRNRALGSVPFMLDVSPCQLGWIPVHGRDDPAETGVMARTDILLLSDVGKWSFRMGGAGYGGSKLRKPIDAK
jgi:hypothetical protein